MATSVDKWTTVYQYFLLFISLIISFPGTKVLNSLLVGGGIVVAIGTSWWVYTLVQRHIRHLAGFPAEVDELAAEAVEDFDEEAPLLSSTHAHDSSLAP